MAYDVKHLQVQTIRWLGAFPSDSEKYGIPEQCLIPLTAEGESFAHMAVWIFCFI